MGNEVLRDEFSDNECGHCGTMVDLMDGSFYFRSLDCTDEKVYIRTLCKECIIKILEWI